MFTEFRKITLRFFIRIFRIYTTIDNFIFSQEFINSVFFVILLFFAGLIRYFALDYSGSDYQNFLSPWYDYIVNHGGWKALSDNFANYTPPYLYFLVILTYLPIPKLVGIKLVSIFFDFILAYLVFLIINFVGQIKEKQQNYDKDLVNQNQQPKKENNQNLLILESQIQTKIANLQSKNVFKTQDLFSQNFSQTLTKHLPIIAFFTILFLPTVIFNGAFWAQCDVIYTTFLVATFFAILRKKYFFAVFWFALSVSFKFQAMFFLPVLIVLLMLRKINFLHFLIILIVYILSILPSFLIGRNFVELLRIYLDQGGTYNSLTMNSPNFYHWFGGGNYEILAKMGLVIAGIVFVGICYLFYHIGKQIWSPDLLFQNQREYQTKHKHNFQNSSQNPISKQTKFAKFSNLFNRSFFNFQNKNKDNPKEILNKINNQNSEKYQIDWNLEVKIIDFWMNLAMISVLVMPYFLPKMHERYFFVADIFAIIYVFWRPQRFWIAILVNLCSFFSYGPFLLGTKPFDFSYLSMALLVTIIYLLVVNIRELKDK